MQVSGRIVVLALALSGLAGCNPATFNAEAG